MSTTTIDHMSAETLRTEILRLRADLDFERENTANYRRLALQAVVEKRAAVVALHELREKMEGCPA